MCHKCTSLIEILNYYKEALVINFYLGKYLASNAVVLKQRNILQNSECITEPSVESYISYFD